ncbi:hypothetical protein PC117_g5007 [Phytophthora cactorum]|uniref:P-loop containing nucleoside triphosphate hydrolase n=1 Tax=Phytophthora cactorum TaxID=29920 RepID=A0A8T1E947_9STRA|nr:hypothetical protein PC117_g5007 [Phytophthora cactorum]
MARKVWFQLVDAATRGAYADTQTASVSSDGVSDIDDLREVIREKYRHEKPDILEGVVADQLRIHADEAAYKAKKQCLPRSSLNELDAQATLIVEVPTQHLVPRTVASVAELIAIPRTTALNESETYAEECLSLTEWDVGVVHKIPLIWEFMSSLGGCTTSGEIFWRMEDKQVVSLMVDGWFRESTRDRINVHANKKSILMGSPGIGKSTLLCVMAFHLVFKHKKNVLVYRRLTKFEQENCLFYLGYEDGKVVQFAVQRCKAPNAISIYEHLIRQQGISNVWLLLDGFRYQDIPEGVRTFKMLATSQQVDLKSQELDDAYCCLFSCWRKQDLFKLGEQVYQFKVEEMEERFYYSGGSVREFGRATAEEIRIAIYNAVTQVEDVGLLLSNRENVQSGRNLVDRLRHTFVNDITHANGFLSREHWEQVID